MMTITLDELKTEMKEFLELTCRQPDSEPPLEIAQRVLLTYRNRGGDVSKTLVDNKSFLKALDTDIELAALANFYAYIGMLPISEESIKKVPLENMVAALRKIKEVAIDTSEFLKVKELEKKELH